MVCKKLRRTTASAYKFITQAGIKNAGFAKSYATPKTQTTIIIISITIINSITTIIIVIIISYY